MIGNLMSNIKNIFKQKRINHWTVIDQSFFSLFLTFALIELSNVGSVLINSLIASNFFGPDAMAAIGIACPIFRISWIVSGVLAIGMQTICSQELGKGNIKEFNRLFSAVFYVGSIVAMIVMLGVFFFAKPLAEFFGASGKAAILSDSVVKYLRGISMGIPAFILTSILSHACQMDSGKKRIIISSIIYSITNSILGFTSASLKLGLFSIGLATSMGEYIRFAYLLFYFCSKNRMLQFTSFNTSIKEFFYLLKLGMGRALRGVCNVIQPIWVNKIIIFYGGTIAMSSISVMNSLYSFFAFLAIGLGNAVALMVGVSYGEGDEAGIRKVGNCGQRNCLLFLVPICAILLTFAKPIARIYISEECELLRMTTFSIRIIALQIPLDGLLRTRLSYLQAVCLTKNMQMLILFSTLIYVVSSAYFLGVLFGCYGVLACFFLSDLLSLLTVYLYYAIKCHKLLPTPHDYMNLPINFYKTPKAVISMEVSDVKDIPVISKQIEFFCKEHGINEKNGYYAANCFEEIAVKIINHSFSISKKTPGIAFRMVYTEKELVLRLKDNCRYFNIKRYISTNWSKKNLEFKIVTKFIQNITYTYSLGTNNIIIRFPLEAYG